jgi:hypothetical protein
MWYDKLPRAIVTLAGLAWTTRPMKRTVLMHSCPRIPIGSNSFVDIVLTLLELCHKQVTAAVLLRSG